MRIEGLRLLAALAALAAFAAPLAAQGLAQAAMLEKAEYHITGATRAEALKERLGLLEKRIFASRQELELFIENRAQELANWRIFAASRIELEELGPGRFAAHVYTEDGWPVVPLFSPAYSNQSGFSFFVAAVMPNVAGSLASVSAEFDFEAPMRNGKMAFGDPNLGFSLSGSGFCAGPARLGASASYAKSSASYGVNGLTVFQKRSHSLSASLSGSVDLVYGIDYFFNAGYFQALQQETVYNYNEAGSRYGLAAANRVSLGQGIGIGALNWQGNFRRNYRAALASQFSFSRMQGQSKMEMAASLSLSGRKAWIAFERLNPQVFGGAVFFFSSFPSLHLGSYSGGIANSELQGDGVIYFGASMPIKVLAFKGIVEIQLGPFADYTLAYSRNQAFHKNLQGFSCGFDFAVYVDKMRSVPLTLSVGFDLRDKYGLQDFGNRVKIRAGFGLR